VRPLNFTVSWRSDAVPRNREYVGHVNLLISGDNLDPTQVTRALGIRPTHSWRKGEKLHFPELNVEFERTHTQGGWKGRVPPAIRKRPVEAQLDWWVKALTPRAKQLRDLRSRGYYLRLAWCVVTSATASLVVPVALQQALARLHLHWEISVLVGQEERDVAS
jgi:hypothetical protein